MRPRDYIERAALRADVAEAGRIVSPVWPIGTFVAVNPLGGLADRPFDEALEIARPLLRIRGLPSASDLRDALGAGRVTTADLRAAARRRHPDLAAHEIDALAARALEDEPDTGHAPRTAGERCDALLGTTISDTADAETAKWCAAFVDEAPSGWRMPGRERGFFSAWREIAPRAPALRRLAAHGVSERLAALPDAPEDAVLHALEILAVAPERRVAELRGNLARLPGWASLAAWHEDQAIHGLDLVELLAVRLTYEAELITATAIRELGGDEPLLQLLARLRHEDAEPPADAVAIELGAIRLGALEGAYADGLLAKLDAAPQPRAETDRPTAQAVFCIDARSEGLRRHLEEQGAYETFGFAGFFGVAMRFRALGSVTAEAQAPVLLDPEHTVDEVPAADDGERFLAGRATLAATERAFQSAKHGGASPFALAELGGWAAGPLAAFKTLGARAQACARGRAREAAAPPPVTEVAVDAVLSEEEQLAIAGGALTTMGLTGGFARLVLLCGHGSTTENNPYAAALDCGACGGHAGGPNARAAAAILNAAGVRAGLAGDGIVIPEDTCFVAGRHDTTTDRVEVLDRHLVPATHAGDLARLEADLRAAGQANAAERLRALPGSDDAVGRSADWAQVRPEWGLARNAAFVAGPRTMTAGLDLGCRTFLHSYDHALDPDGAALETILTAPLVVAHWINAQYFFSTTDPDVLGAGDKVVHNAVAGIGVLQGAGGDLRIGLPRQACFAGDRPYHEPLRLLAVVQAPLGLVDAVVERNVVLRRLFDGAWVGLAVREAPGEPWLRRADGDWEPWVAAPPVEVAA